jgi:glycosyltransferase involved in cell wall biosynthesis
MKKISIIIPAYNEEKRIGKTLTKYSDYFENLCKTGVLEYEILVVINNTKDNTEGVIKEFAKKNKRIRYLNFKQGGKGFAVIEGFKDALKRDNDHIGFLDADMATPPYEFHRLVTHMGRYDGVIASRYLGGSVINPDLPKIRTIGSRLFNFLVRNLFFLPYHDTQCGAKIFTRRALEKTLPTLSMSQWAFDVELLYQLRKNGFRLFECPTRWSNVGSSHLGSSSKFIYAGTFMVLGLMRLRLINSPLSELVRVYNQKVLGYVGLIKN